MSCKKEDKNGEKRAVVVAIVRKILGHKIAVGRGGWGGVKIWCHAVQMNLSYHSFIHSLYLSICHPMRNQYPSSLLTIYIFISSLFFTFHPKIFIRPFLLYSHLLYTFLSFQHYTALSFLSFPSSIKEQAKVHNIFILGRSMMELESCVPPGFRFHPTEEELVGYYLRRKINSLKIDLDVIIEIDLYKMEPWDIQARCNVGNEEQSEWYFFSYKDRKYPTGTRTNRATAAGFWKATGRDKSVLSKNNIIGMRKTLVFYKGRAPNGRKTDWIMHEYRLQTSEHGPPQEEGWVVCRAFRKPCPNQRQGFEAWSHGYYMRDNSQVRPPVSLSDIATTSHLHLRRNQGSSFYESYGSEQELVSNTHNFLDSQQVIELPQLDSPITVSPSLAEKEVFHCDEEKSNESSQIHVIDWKNFDNLFNSQLTDTTSYPYQTAALIPQNDELEAQQHHLLGCFPGS